MTKILAACKVIGLGICSAIASGPGRTRIACYRENLDTCSGPSRQGRAKETAFGFLGRQTFNVECNWSQCCGTGSALHLPELIRILRNPDNSVAVLRAEQIACGSANRHSTALFLLLRRMRPGIAGSMLTRARRFSYRDERCAGATHGHCHQLLLLPAPFSIQLNVWTGVADMHGPIQVSAHCSRIFGFTEGPPSSPTVECAARALASWFGRSRRANDQPLHGPAAWLP